MSLTSIRRQRELTTLVKVTPIMVARGSKRGRTKITAKLRPNYRELPLRSGSKLIKLMAIVALGALLKLIAIIIYYLTSNLDPY